MERPKEIEVYDFGRVCVPMQVCRSKGRLETVLEFGVKDLSRFIGSIWSYYYFKSDRTNRQTEIAELADKLQRLLKKEKKVFGEVWSPISLEKD